MPLQFLISYRSFITCFFSIQVQCSCGELDAFDIHDMPSAASFCNIESLFLILLLMQLSGFGRRQ